MRHIYEVRPRKDKRGFDLISDALAFGRLWYTTIPDAIEYAKHRSRAHDAVISVYDAAGNDRDARTPGPVQRVVIFSSRGASVPW